MKPTITKMKAVILFIAIILFASTNTMQILATTIVGWDFTSLNSTLGTTGIALSSIQTNPSPTQTQTLSGGLYGSFKRVSSSVDGLFEINFSGVPTTNFTITSLSMDINSNGAVALGGNFQVQLQHPDVNGGAFTNVGALKPYGFDAASTVNFSSDLSAVTNYNHLNSVAVKIIFTVFGPNTRTIKIDNLLMNGTVDPGTALNSTKIQGVTFDGITIYNQSNLNLQIFDITGRKILTSTENINMNDKAKGIYFVKSNSGTFKILNK